MTALDTCRCPNKKLFADEDAALVGAEAIGAKAEAAGGTYDQLYPYRCPGADHWHLSSKRQGTATCPVCFDTEAPAWHTGEIYVIAAHDHAGEPCDGTGAGEQNSRLGSARAAVGILTAIGAMPADTRTIFDDALDSWEADIAAMVRARRRANAAEREVERLRNQLAAAMQVPAPVTSRATPAQEAAPKPLTTEGPTT